MEENPRVGLIIMRAEWFGYAAAKPIIESVESDAMEMTSRLGLYFEVLGPWVVDSAERMQACTRAMVEADPDLVLLAFQTWADDLRLEALLDAVGSRPLIVWCYQPWRRAPRPAQVADVLRGSGAVGSFAALGMLRNLGAGFQFTFGSPDDPRLIHDLKVAGRAAQVRRGLRSARIGLLPSNVEPIQVNLVDETRLKAELGPAVQHYSVEEYLRVFDSLAQVRVDAYLEQIYQNYKVKEVGQAALRRAAQAALGLAHLAIDYRLDVLAVSDTSPQLLQALQLRPALYPDLLDPLPVLFQPAGDLGAATANYVLHHLTGSATMLVEILFWDEARNQVICGHGGMQNPLLAEGNAAWISPDHEFQPPGLQVGAQFQFVARSGRVTLFQLRSTPKSWQAIALSGMCLESRPWVNGYPHALLRLDTTIQQFLNRLASVGASQHWILAYGNVIEELESLCQMTNIPLEVLTM